MIRRTTCNETKLTAPMTRHIPTVRPGVEIEAAVLNRTADGEASSRGVPASCTCWNWDRLRDLMMLASSLHRAFFPPSRERSGVGWSGDIKRRRALCRLGSIHIAVITTSTELDCYLFLEFYWAWLLLGLGQCFGRNTLYRLFTVSSQNFVFPIAFLLTNNFFSILIITKKMIF